jgi:hypothetical protein
VSGHLERRIILRCSIGRLNNDGAGTTVSRQEIAAQHVVGVRVERREPPDGCRPLGFVEGTAPAFGDSYENSVRGLQREAAKRGGNWVTIDATGMRNMWVSTTRGRAYFCDDEVLEADRTTRASGSARAEASTTAPSTCEPDCSPGYTCLRGTCVSACNPSCSAGERCGADRMCHPEAH